MISVDTLVSEIQDISGFDVLVVSSGSGGNNSCANLISNPATLQMISSAVDSGLIVGAMCSGVKVLAASGVLSGIHVTSNLRDSTYCTSRGAIHEGICGFPVIDGQIVTTSIGDYYHHQNTEAVMTAFCENMKKKKAVPGESGLVAASFLPSFLNGSQGNTILPGSRPTGDPLPMAAVRFAIPAMAVSSSRVSPFHPGRDIPMQ